jgi:hypothetical protein
MAKNDAKNAENGAKETKAPGPFAVLRPYSLPEGTTLPTGDNGEAVAAPGVLFELVGEFVGKTSKQAIGQAVAAHGGGEYVAVPKRSFTPRKVESVGVPRLKWS